MTTIIAWASYQNGQQSALSFASDSRLSWGKTLHWNYGRKIFWCKSSPDIFGFAGDMVFQSTILSQVCEIFDHSLVSQSNLPEQRHMYFVDLLKAGIDVIRGLELEGVQTFHGLRDDSSGTPYFRLWHTRFDKASDCWSDQEMIFKACVPPSQANDPRVFFSAGSGSGKHRAALNKRRQESGETSRSIFRALVDVIEEAKDPSTGGLPQIVSLGRKGHPKPVGLCFGDSRSVCGVPIGPLAVGGDIEWRNENFEFLNSESLQRKSGAQRHFFSK